MRKMVTGWLNKNLVNNYAARPNRGRMFIENSFLNIIDPEVGRIIKRIRDM